MRPCPQNSWEFDPEEASCSWDAFVHMVIDIARFICQPQNCHVSKSVTVAHTDGKIKILCSEYWIGVLAFSDRTGNFSN